MTDPHPPHPTHDHDDGFSSLLAAMQRHMDAALAAHPTAAVLSVETDGLFDAFLGALPEADGVRQHYNCNACRAFVRRHGGLVVVREDGEGESLTWPHDHELAVSPILRAAVAAVLGEVALRVFAGRLRPYASEDAVWGTPNTGPEPDRPEGWTHFAVRPPARLVHRDRVETSRQRAARLREEHGSLARGLAEFPRSLVARAHRLLADGVLYRGDRFVPYAKWLLDLHDARAVAPAARQATALTWRAAVLAPAGWCHVRSGMLGTLLEDLAADKPQTDVARAWAAKMDPSSYQRAQAAPRAGNVAQAERLFAELGLAPALRRRYATVADLLDVVWTPTPRPCDSDCVSTPDGDCVSPKVCMHGPGAVLSPLPVFGHLLNTDGRRRSVAVPGDAPAVTMTWDKFSRTVLPDAARIELKVPATSERFAALTTAVHPDAPPILQWDGAGGGPRCPVSWYYHGGVDAEMRRRVEQAGGKYTECDVRASLLWNDRSDLDLHVTGPEGEVAYYSKRVGDGWLDVDMNVSGETDRPVENVRWPRGLAPKGGYSIAVHNFTPRTANSPFTLELEVAGQVYRYTGTAPGTHATTRVCSFEYLGGPLREPPRVWSAVKLESSVATTPASGGTDTPPNEWGLVPGTWAEVTSVIPGPSAWGNLPNQHGRHLFFLLAGAEDRTKGKGRGLFVEHLRGELRPVRATIDAHVAASEVEPPPGDAAPACGVGVTDQRPWGPLALRVVRRDGTVSHFEVDRWD